MTVVNDVPAVPLARCSVERPDGRHFCQIHHDEDSLADAIFRFTRSGLQERDRVHLLTPAARAETVFGKLRADGVDVRRLVSSGRIVVTTPADFRRDCERNGVFDLDAFRESFNAIFAQHDVGVRLRLYGELSNTFWHEGDVEMAVRLDEICNECLDGRRVAVFCGYLFDGLEQNSYRPEIERICRAHSWFPVTPEDARLRVAVDEASVEVLGVPLSVALNRSNGEQSWWHRLPLARRTVFWLQSNMPSAMIRVLDLARSNYRS